MDYVLQTKELTKKYRNFQALQGINMNVPKGSIYGLVGRPPCPSPTAEFTETRIHQVTDAIQPSHPLSSPSPPAPNPSQHQGLFQ